MDDEDPPIGFGLRELEEQAVFGPHELAALCGVEVATVQQWQFRGILPERDFTVHGRPAWNPETVIQWGLKTGRLVAVTTYVPRSRQGLHRARRES